MTRNLYLPGNNASEYLGSLQINIRISSLGSNFKVFLSKTFFSSVHSSSKLLIANFKVYPFKWQDGQDG